MSELSQADKDFLVSKGLDPSQYSYTEDSKMSSAGAIGATLRAHAGGLLGGGVGTLAGIALAPETGGLSLAIPIAGSLIGSYAGQKTQQAVLPDEVEQRLQRQAQEAQASHPNVSMGTDIVAGALASGGKPSLGSLLKGGKSVLAGDLTSPVLKRLALSAAINPAIDTGVSLASGEGMPSMKQLGADTAGGALFYESSALGRLAHRGPVSAPLPEGEPVVKDLNAVNDTTTPLKMASDNLSDTSNIESISNKRVKQINDTLGDGKLYLNSDGTFGNNSDKVLALSPNGELSPPTPPPKDEQDELQSMELNSRKSQKYSDDDFARYNELQTQLKGHLDKGDFDGFFNTQKEFEDIRNKYEGMPPLKDDNKIVNTGRRFVDDEQNPTIQHLITKDPSTSKIRITDFSVSKETGQWEPDWHTLYDSEQAAVKSLADKGLKEMPYSGKHTFSPEVKVGEEGRLIVAPPDVVSHIMTGTATTKSVLQGFADSEGHPLQSIAKKIIDIGDKDGLNVRWKPSTTEERGAYSSIVRKSTGQVVDEHISIPQNSAGDSRILLEEGLHGLITPKLPVELIGLKGKQLNDGINKYLETGNNESVKDILRAYQKAAEALGIQEHLFGDNYTTEGTAGNPDETEETLAQSMSEQHRPTFYAMGSPDEFVVHAFRNEQFQNILNEIPYDGKKSIWQHMVDAVKKMFGFDVKQGSMLDHVLRTGTDLIAQDRPGLSSVGKAQSSELSEGRSQARKSVTVDDEYHMGGIGRFTRSVVDRVRDITHPGAKPLADAAKQSLNEQDRLVGKWKNSIIEAGRGLTEADKAQINKVKDLELSTKTLQRGQLTTDAQRKYYDTAKKIYADNADYRIASKEPVMEGNRPRLLKKDPSYWAGMANQKIEQVYRENSDHPEIARLDKQFDQWNQQSLGMTPKGSALRISEWKKAIQGSLKSADVSHQDYFNASRKAMGSPLPPEFREFDPVKNDARYFDRQAIDNSHYKFIESNPKAMAALGQTKDAWGQPIKQYPEGAITAHPQVRALLDQFRGEPHGPMADTERSLSSALSAAFISGPALETHKLISNQVKAVSFADNPYQLARALGYAVTNIKEGYIHAKENGVVKLSANSALDMFNGSLTSAQRLNGLGKAIRDISTLGGITTKLNAGLLQSYFEYLVPSKIARANAGDVTNQQFVRRLDPTYTVGKRYSPQETQQLASVASNYVHGTGDIRSMPAWMMTDSETSGFFKLAHWSVAQTNNFMHDVYTPARNGDYGPLITSVFGSVIGGYLIKSLREELQGKKGGIPSLTEIASSSRGMEGNAGLLAYNAIAAMQYSGFGGLLSQVLKYPFDFVYKNNPQGATFPLDQIATDLAKTFGNVSSAIANDPNLNWVDLAKAVTGHILSTDMQLSRMALNQGINAGLVTGLPAEKKLLSDKLGELRRFDMTEGIPYGDIDQGTNPMMNIEQQKFKHDDNVSEAAQMIPQLVNNIIQKYGDKPDVMLSKIKALKENQYATFPSLETSPLSFFKYITYLNKSVGPEAGQAALMDYMKHKAINSVKAGIVP